MKVVLPEVAFKRPLLAIGTTGAGKSYNQCGARVIPMLEAGEQVVIVDPTDAWFGLNLKPDGKTPSGYNLPIFGGEHGHKPLTPNMGAAMGELLGRERISTILSLKHMDDSEQVEFVGELSKALLVHNRKPLHYIIDEADEFCPQMVDRSSRAVQVCKRQIKRIVTRGRKSGFRPVLITQRPQALDTSVRNQCQVLVALQLMGIHERKMLDDYVKSNGDPAQVAGMMSTLVELGVGEAWVWWPRGRYLERVKFPKIPVFDSFNDDDDAFAPRGATKLADADLSAIDEALASYLQAQMDNDPAELRRRIAELERELDGAGPDPASDSALEHARQEGFVRGSELAAEREHDAWKRGFDEAFAMQEEARLERIKALGELVSSAFHVHESLKELAAEPQFAKPIHQPPDVPRVRLTTPAYAREAPRPSVAPHFNAVVEQAQARAAKRRTAAPRTPSSGHGKAGKAILDNLAQWKAWGFPGVTINQLALLTEYHPRTKGFTNALGALKTAGLVEKSGDILALTAAGEKEAAAPTLGRSQIYVAIQKQADKAARDIMDTLKAGGGEMAWDDIAKELNLHPRTKGLTNGRGWLNTLTVIEKRGDKYRLNNWVLGVR